jgi:hypothetical protein
MNPMPDPKIELYANDPAAHTAEVDFVRCLVAALSAAGHPALVVSQPRLPGCTPDFLVANDGGARLVDVKTFAGTLHGSQRDQKWKVKIGSLAAKSVPNVLSLLKRQRETLLDDMRAGGKTIGAPLHDLKNHVTAIAAVWPALQPGSTCDRDPGNPAWYRIADGADAARQVATETIGPGWSLGHWRRFVTEHLKAIPIGSLDELCEPALYHAMRCADEYRSEFTLRFGSNRQPFVPDPAFAAELAAATASDGIILVHGPSGSGKTAHLAAHAVDLARSGAVTVFTSAEAFDGCFDKLLDVAVAGYSPSGVSSILAALPRLTAQRRVLFVDAVDAGPGTERRTLFSQIAAQWERGLWSLIILSSKSEKPDDDGRLPMRSLRKAALSGAHRKAVYDAHRDSPRPIPWLEPLLEVATDGVAVRALAVSGAGLAEGASLSEAIGAYVRQEIPAENGLVALQILRTSAAAMESRFAQSMRMAELEALASSLCRAEGAGLAVGDSVLRSPLFRRYGDRISFAHERLQVYLAAEALAIAGDDVAILIAKLKQPRNRGYVRYLLGMPQHRFLPFLIGVCSILQDNALIEPLISGEFGKDLQLAAVSHARNFLLRYRQHLDEPGCIISFNEPETSKARPRPRLESETNFDATSYSDTFAIHLLEEPFIVDQLAEEVADTFLSEEQALIRAAQLHSSNPRFALQTARKLAVDDDFGAGSHFLLLRLYHRSWMSRGQSPLVAAVAALPLRAGVLAEILSVQAKLSEPLDDATAAKTLTRWVELIRHSGFKPGLVLEHMFPRIVWENWQPLIRARQANPAFKALLDGLVEEALSGQLIFDDTLFRFATEIGVIAPEAIEDQTERYLRALRLPESATPDDNRVDPTEALAHQARGLYDRALELDEWEAWEAAWGQLSSDEKRSYARRALPCGPGALPGGIVDSIFVSFLSADPAIEPPDLVGVFFTPPWKAFIFGSCDLSATHLNLAATWSERGLSIPEDAFSSGAYAEGDGPAWPLFLKIVHAAGRPDSSGLEGAKKMFATLRTDFPLTIPDLLTALLGATSDHKHLVVVRDRMFNALCTEIAEACAYAAGNLRLLRPLIRRAALGEPRTIAVIFQLCLRGGTENRGAVERYVDDPTYGQLAIAAIREKST